jgi:hypothetical protein
MWAKAARWRHRGGPRAVLDHSPATLILARPAGCPPAMRPHRPLTRIPRSSPKRVPPSSRRRRVYSLHPPPAWPHQSNRWARVRGLPPPVPAPPVRTSRAARWLRLRRRKATPARESPRSVAAVLRCWSQGNAHVVAARGDGVALQGASPTLSRAQCIGGTGSPNEPVRCCHACAALRRQRPASSAVANEKTSSRGERAYGLSRVTLDHAVNDVATGERSSRHEAPRAWRDPQLQSDHATVMTIAVRRRGDNDVHKPLPSREIVSVVFTSQSSLGRCCRFRHRPIEP